MTPKCGRQERQRSRWRSSFPNQPWSSASRFARRLARRAEETSGGGKGTQHCNHKHCLGIPRLDQWEQHFFIADPKNNLQLFLRLLTSETLLAGGRRAVLYVHGATFPSALSIAHRFE